MESVKPVEDTISTKREPPVRSTCTPSSPEQSETGTTSTLCHSRGIPGQVPWESACQPHHQLIPATRSVYSFKDILLCIVFWRTAVSVTMLQSRRAYNVPRGSQLFIRKKKNVKVFHRNTDVCVFDESIK